MRRGGEDLEMSGFLGLGVRPVGFSIGLRMFVGELENASELELNTVPHRT